MSIEVVYFDNPLSGCTDPTACNYDPNAFCDDQSCFYDATPTISIDPEDEVLCLSPGTEWD